MILTPTSWPSRAIGRAFMVLIGKQVKAGVYAGIEAGGDDFVAMDINININTTTTGAPDKGGDLAISDSLKGVTRTIGRCLGIDQAPLASELMVGKALSVVPG